MSQLKSMKETQKQGLYIKEMQISLTAAKMTAVSLFFIEVQYKSTEAWNHIMNVSTSWVHSTLCLHTLGLSSTPFKLCALICNFQPDKLNIKGTFHNVTVVSRGKSLIQFFP